MLRISNQFFSPGEEECLLVVVLPGELWLGPVQPEVARWEAARPVEEGSLQLLQEGQWRLVQGLQPADPLKGWGLRLLTILLQLLKAMKNM